MSAAHWLRRAEEHLFLSGVNDVAEALSAANMVYGLAKIQFAERFLGLEPRARFVGTPDATVTRNLRRWRQGFGYGGLVRWDESLAILDAKPNGCGMLIGVPQGPILEQEVREAARAARGAREILEGVELVYDLGDSNHFVDALELEELLVPESELPAALQPAADAPATGLPATGLPPELFLIHSSGPEHRAASPLGPGLYLDESAALARQAQAVETPWGPLSLLRDQAARDFTDFCLAVQAFNARRREHYAGRLFGPHHTLANVTHQGMSGPGIFQLGAYRFSNDGLLPFPMGPDQPVYLLRPRPNFSPAAQERLGWRARARDLGLTEELRTANLIPHGTGYGYPDLRRLVRVEAHGPRRRFILERKDGTLLEMEDARALPFVYRDLAILERLLALEMAEPLARYRIRFVIKD